MKGEGARVAEERPVRASITVTRLTGRRDKRGEGGPHRAGPYDRDIDPPHVLARLRTAASTSFTVFGQSG